MYHLSGGQGGHIGGRGHWEDLARQTVGAFARGMFIFYLYFLFFFVERDILYFF